MNRRTPLHVGTKGIGRIAFVLSGGGSLGAVQVGMLKAMFQSGMRPDLLIGTSVGAVNAAWVAGRPSVEGMAELAKIWGGLRRQHVFPLSPITGVRGLLGRTNHFISSDGLRSILENNIPFGRLEDAVVPLHVVTTELKSGRAVILSSGEAIPALLASTAIPGVFPPVTIDGREHVDGAVANHTPVTAAIELGATTIYVLPVGYPWVNREPTNALGMALHALARIVEQKLDAEVALHRSRADIHVLPALDLADTSPADFSRTRELIEWGYTQARRYLAGTVGGRARARLAPEPVQTPLRLDPTPAQAA